MKTLAILARNDQIERSERMYTSNVLWAIAKAFMPDYDAQAPSALYADAYLDKIKSTETAEDIKNSIAEKLKKLSAEGDESNGSVYTQSGS